MAAQNVRSLNGSQRVVVTPGGTVGLDLNDACTFAALAKRTNNNSWDALIAGRHSSLGAVWVLELPNRSVVGFDMFLADDGSVFVDSTIDVTTTDGWAVLVVTMPSGTGAITRFSRGILGGAWTHTTPATTRGSALGAMNAGGHINIGAYEDSGGSMDGFDGYLAAVAVFDKSLTQTEVETLDNSLQAWVDLSPVELWRPGDATVDSLVGTSTQSSAAGTIDNTQLDSTVFDLAVTTAGATSLPPDRKRKMWNALKAA